MVELVAVHHASPAALAAVLERSDGLHHVARFVASFEDEQQRLEAIGWPEATSQSHNCSIYARCRAAAIDWDGSNPLRAL